MKINAATLETYNANNRGNNVGDCVKRSMSLAFDIPYYKMGQLLNAKMKELRKPAWNIQSVFEPLIRDLGCKAWKECPNRVTVEDFVDNMADPAETYLLLVGKTYPRTSHLVCVRDGRVWDSWDCRNYLVARYYIIADSVSHKALTDIRDHIEDLCSEYAEPTVNAEIGRQINKYKMSGSVEMRRRIEGYTIKIYLKLTLEPTDICPKQRLYRMEIALPLEPTMTAEEAITFITKTSKVRVYDRMYAVAGQERKLKEEYEMLAQVGKTNRFDSMWLDGRETKFYNSLPGWAKALVRYVRVTDPGQYHNSYELSIDKLPGDDTHPNSTRYVLYDYDADGIKEQLDRYAKYGEIEGIDYYKDW